MGKGKVIDDELQAVLHELPDDWIMFSFERAGMGWISILGKGNTRLFRLVSDRGYISVEKIVSGRPTFVDPPDELRINISPSQVAELILRHHR